MNLFKNKKITNAYGIWSDGLQTLAKHSFIAPLWTLKIVQKLDLKILILILRLDW